MGKKRRTSQSVSQSVSQWKQPKRQTHGLAQTDRQTDRQTASERAEFDSNYCILVYCLLIHIFGHRASSPFFITWFGPSVQQFVGQLSTSTEETIQLSHDILIDSAYNLVHVLMSHHAANHDRQPVKVQPKDLRRGKGFWTGQCQG